MLLRELCALGARPNDEASPIAKRVVAAAWLSGGLLLILMREVRSTLTASMDGRQASGTWCQGRE
jgi:hypothetical protein